MSDSGFHEKKILQSWRDNAAPWAKAIDGGTISSRTLVTDQAIVDLLQARAPLRLLDVGCGEGWLSRAVAKSTEAEVWGLDAAPELLKEARARSPRIHFLESTYESMEAVVSRTTESRFDTLVCNFSLIGDRSTEAVFRAARTILRPGGYLVIQTLHPITGCGEEPYSSGWREGSWAGFEGDFTDAPPWYFRTLEDWMTLFTRSGFSIVNCQEPLLPQGHSQAGRPASLILVGSNTGSKS